MGVLTMVFVSTQTHPNVDKKLFTAESVIGLKNPEKSFPLNNDVGVLKWRLQTTDESLIPLTSTFDFIISKKLVYTPTAT